MIIDEHLNHLAILAEIKGVGDFTHLYHQMVSRTTIGYP